jgi:hypothetical protein
MPRPFTKEITTEIAGTQGWRNWQSLQHARNSAMTYAGKTNEAEE